MALKKRFQSFISSTYADLRPERDEIANAIQAMGHFPAGMELFGSDAEDSWTVIERTIDLSDYFVLVLAGRYGTLSEVGVSFVEREFDYASSKGVPILAFIHEDIDKLPAGVVEKTAKAQRLLRAFRKKVTDTHQVTFWRDKSDLSTKVVASLAKAIAIIPRPGWVRGDIEMEVQSLKSEKYELAQRVHQLEQEIRVKNAQIDASAASDAGPTPAASVPVTLKWNKWTYNAEVDMPSLAAWLYSFQLRIHSAHSFAFAAYLSALSSDAMSRNNLSHPGVGPNGVLRISTHNWAFTEAESLSPESLAEIATSAMASGLIITDDPRAEAFQEYWKQHTFSGASPEVFATINDSCWMNCARHYTNLPVEMRPELNPENMASWSNWAAKKNMHGSDGRGAV